MEEQRKQFIDHIKNMVAYWDAQPGQTQRQKLEGLAFSILVALDGGAGDLPSYAVIPLREGDEVPEGDLGGALHEDFVTR